MHDDRALEPVKVTARDLSSGRMVEIGITMRRRTEAKLWESFTPEQERAATRIGGAFAVLDRGVGLQESSLARAMRGAPGRTMDPAALAVLLHDYFAWGRECTRRRISHAAIIDVLGYGLSCWAVDRARRRANGWARAQLHEGLDLYCQLRGWRRAA